MNRTNVKIGFLLFAISMLLFSNLSAVAQEGQPKLALTITAEKEIVVEREGKAVLERIPADKMERGDVLAYTITYVNEGETPARDAAIVDPIPEGTVYVLDSATGERTEITYSVDGGHLFQRPPVKFVVRYPDGTKEYKAAPAEMVTHIKWVIKTLVQPGQSGRLSFKVAVK